jgi:hypothetical protein
VEEFGDHDPVFVCDIDAGIGDAFEERVAPPDLVVQDAVAADYLRVDVGEQPVGDVLLLAELGQDLLVVVRDRVELDVRGLELLEGVAQLTELRPARGSPHRRSVEDHDRLRLAAALVVVDELTVGVRENEVRKPLADLRARRMPIGKANPAGMSERCRCVESVVISFYRHACSTRTTAQPNSTLS